MTRIKTLNDLKEFLNTLSPKELQTVAMVQLGDHNRFRTIEAVQMTEINHPSFKEHYVLKVFD